MRSTHSMVISMRLPAESGKGLKRMANMDEINRRDCERTNDHYE
jgi:hypothetical protein